jgi:hypothetical protein
MALAPQDILAQTINSAYEANLGRPADLSGMTHYLGEIASGNKTVDQVIADLEYAGQQFSQPGQAEYIAPDATYYELPDTSQQQYIETRIQEQQSQPQEGQAPVTVTSESSFEDRVESITGELKNMYGVVTEFEPKASYRGLESDLDKIFGNQAKKLAEKGVSSLAQLTERKDENGKRFLVNKETNETLFRITKDRDTGADKWGDVFSGVKDGANFGIQFDSEGRAVLFPVHEKTKSIGQQLLGRELNAFIEPIAVIVGAYYGGVPGAAIGSAFGQYAATGEIDPERVVKAAATTYISTEFASADYATKVGNSVLPTELANTATAKIVGNAVVNSGVSGLIAVATGGNVEQSMITGAIVGGAIASSPDIANTLLGGEQNVQDIANATGLGLRQAQDIIASSIADAVVADAQNRDGFGTALGASLVARGVATAAANKAVEFVSNNLTTNPQALTTVFNGTKGFAQVATDAAVRGQDVGDAVKAAGPGIVLQAGLSGLERPQDKVVQLPPSEGGIQVAGDLGSGDTLDILGELKAQKLIDEVEVDQQTQEVDGVLERRTVVEGVRNDGMPYQYTIITDELGNTFYEHNPDALTTVVTRERPEIKSQTGSFALPATFLEDYNALIDLRSFGDSPSGRRAVIGGGGYGTGNFVGFNFIGFDDRQREKYDVGGESFTLFVLPNIKMLASDITDKIYYIDLQMPPETTPDAPPELKLTPKTTEQVKVELTKPEEQPKRPLQAGEAAEKEDGATGAEGAEGASGTPGGAAPGDVQESLRKELATLEQELQSAQREFEQTQINLGLALEQRERLSAPNLVAAVGPDLQSSLDNELRDLERAETEARERVETLGTRISDIGASQQEGDAGRPSSEVIGDLVRGGSGTGLPGDEGAGTGGLGGGFGPGAGEEGAGSGSGEEGEGPGSGTGGFGPGAGREGEGTGGGGEGEGGAGEDISPLRPVTIFDSPDGRPATPFASRVTGEALAGILGAKEPLFGGDPDEQRAVWNRRSLRLRRALGL